MSRSSLQQSQIEKLVNNCKQKKSKFKQVAEIKESPKNEKLCLFNEIFLYGLSKKKEFKEIDCLWEFTNQKWKDLDEICEKVFLELS